MKKHEYPNLGETLYEEVLPNGLSVLVAVKPGFRKNAAFFATRYGGADRRFKVNGEWIMLSRSSGCSPSFAPPGT